MRNAPDPAALLAWYDRHRRRLPWRALPGEAPDAYRVWLSEIMLQQTTVKAVAPYYAQVPQALADACASSPRRSSTTCSGPGPGSATTPARATCMPAPRRWPSEHRGRFPDSEEALRALPGIGAYTAAAIAAIAFDRRAVAIDGNIERVIARLFAVEAAAAGGEGRNPPAAPTRWCRSAGPAISRRR